MDELMHEGSDVLRSSGVPFGDDLALGDEIDVIDDLQGFWMSWVTITELAPSASLRRRSGGR